MVALRYHGYHVAHVAYAENDASCLRILRAHFPRATELGPVEGIQMSRFKRWFQDWSKEFDIALFDSGSPCQGFTMLSAERKGLEDSRSELFWYVPPAIVAAGDALAGSGKRLGFVEENVNMPEAPRRIISHALGCMPMLIESASASMARRRRNYWTNIPLEVTPMERVDEREGWLDVVFEGQPPDISHTVPEGWTMPDLIPGQQVFTLTCCQPMKRPPKCPTRDVGAASEEAHNRWRLDQYRYPLPAYEDCNGLHDGKGGFKTWTSTMREAMQHFPDGWTRPEPQEDHRCRVLGNAYQCKIYGRVIARLDGAPVASAAVLGAHQAHIGNLRTNAQWHKWMTPIIAAATLAQGSADLCRDHRGALPVADIEAPFPIRFDEWPELRVCSCRTYNEAVTDLMHPDVQEAVGRLLPCVGELEKLVAPLRDWIHAWAREGRSLASPVGPDLEVIGARAERATSIGHQRGGYRSTVAMPTQVPVGLGKEGQLEYTASMTHPYHLPTLMEHDCQYAIHESFSQGPEVAENRRHRDKLLTRISAAVRPAETAARAAQTRKAKICCGELNLVFIAVLLTLIMWPHRKLVLRMSTGYSAMGSVESSGLFREASKPAKISVDELLSTAAEWHDELFMSQPPLDAAEIHAATLEEVTKGQLGKPYSRFVWDQRYGANGWRAVVRFGLWQGEKFRPIDDGKRSRHNEAQGIQEKVHTCPVEFPAMVAIVAAQIIGQKWPWWFELEIGTEDLQDAYRGSPTDEDSTPFTIVAFFCVFARAWRAAEMYGHSFGFKSSVNNFNPWPEFLVAVARRVLWVITAHFVDDFPIVDHVAGKGTAQRSANKLLNLCGTSFSPKKQRLMETRQTFLGEIHDYGKLQSQGVVIQQATEERKQKLQTMINESRTSGKMTPAQANKMRGTVQAYASTVHGQIAKGGSQPLVAQSQASRPQLLPSTMKALDYVETMIHCAPPRHIFVGKDRRVVRCWSDAEYDMEKPQLGGGLGYVLQDNCQTIVGACRISANVIESFLPRKQQIGQLEAVVPFVAMYNHPEMLSNCDAIWGIDNASAEAGLIRGYSSKADTANLIAATHIVQARLDLRTFWFHVDSDSNPSDGASRDGLRDEWTQEMAAKYKWRLTEAEVPPLSQWQDMPFRLLVNKMYESTTKGGSRKT